MSQANPPTEAPTGTKSILDGTPEQTLATLRLLQDHATAVQLAIAAYKQFLEFREQAQRFADKRNYAFSEEAQDYFEKICDQLNDQFQQATSTPTSEREQIARSTNKSRKLKSHILRLRMFFNRGTRELELARHTMGAANLHKQLRAFKKQFLDHLGKIWQVSNHTT